MITVETVDGPAALKTFIQVPQLLYKDDPHFVPQLMIERREHLGPKNPYFRHAAHAFFIAFQQGRPVGRISAQLDSMAQAEGRPVTGHFGFLDAADEDVLAALLDKAESWLKTHEAQRVRGPFSLSINDEAGMLFEGHDSPPRVMMNYAPPWLGAAVEAHGYAKAKDLIAYRMRADQNIPDKAQRMADKALAQDNVTERPLDKKHLESDLKLILDIFNEAWADNWGFVPMTEEEIAYTAENMKPLIIPDLVRLVMVDGKAAAMIVALPDMNEAIAGLDGKLLPLGWARLLWRLKVKGVTGARVMLMGVRKEFQNGFLGSAISVALIARLHEALRRHGFEDAELSWILEDNEPIIRTIESVGGQAYKTYRVYEKDLV